MIIKSIIICVPLFILASCQSPKVKEESQNTLVVFRFELDSAGNILETHARDEIMAFGKEIHESGRKVMMHVYTEQTGSIEQNEELGWTMARAAKTLMKTQGERSAYNVGIEVRGYQNPIDSLNPSDIINRRIEVIPTN